jgi:ribosomal protein L20
MPRSVNSVAKEQEEKIMKQAKGFFGRRKTFGQLLRMR